MPSDPAHWAAYGRRVTWASWALLLAVQFADTVVDGLPWIVASAKILPLLLFVPGMLRDSLRSYIWLCFVCLLYFIALVLRLFGDTVGVRPVVGMIGVIGLFVSAMLYVRWQSRALRAAQTPAALVEESDHE